MSCSPMTFLRCCDTLLQLGSRSIQEWHSCLLAGAQADMLMAPPHRVLPCCCKLFFKTNIEQQMQNRRAGQARLMH